LRALLLRREMHRVRRVSRLGHELQRADGHQSAQRHSRARGHKPPHYLWELAGSAAATQGGFLIVQIAHPEPKETAQQHDVIEDPDHTNDHRIHMTLLDSERHSYPADTGHYSQEIDDKVRPRARGATPLGGQRKPNTTS
jgi:hypothetical protein